MIPVDSLLYKIDQRLNKLSSSAHQSIQLEDKILALNEAQLKLIEQKVGGISIISRQGMDAVRKRYEDLQNLIEDYSDHALNLELKDEKLNQWSCDLSKLAPAYLFYADAFLLADKGRCKDHKIWINQDLLKHGNLSLLMNNEHYRPSFEYQETFSSVSGNQLSIFTDGTFIPKKLYLMYLRYPKYIDKAGYEKFDGSLSVDQDCELELYLEDDLLDLTVQNLGMYTENPSAVQSAQFRIQTNE